MKALSKLVALAFAITISSAPSFGQVNLTNHSGLYMTTNDFITKKLSYAYHKTYKIKHLFEQSLKK